MGEINLYGVFVPSLLVWACIALAVTLVLRQLLRLSGLYRLVWHAALFDVALFVILLGGVIALASDWIPT